MGFTVGTTATSLLLSLRIRDHGDAAMRLRKMHQARRRAQRPLPPGLALERMMRRLKRLYTDYSPWAIFEHNPLMAILPPRET